ncbi:adenylate/guanylate cyclase domain-containing protein [Pelagibius sp. Alg239-R121]|uniref:adenylate/guanylate cyclase domain-containing protein n=1 Tax=Pelagibius sp. Alg239-R121 TaxID=2993448 RepID=UPI0024A6ED78|nr:adenylate/guanylate cyclase domain-containing protein [Pelagibius sp. Alg239-R121]
MTSSARNLKRNEQTGRSEQTGQGVSPDTTRQRSSTFPVSLVLAGSMAVLVLTAVAFVLFIGLWTSQRNTIDLLNNQLELIVGSIESDVRGYLEPALAQVEFVRRRIATGAVDPSDRQRLTDLLSGSLAAAPQIEVIVYWDKDFRQLVILNDSSGQAATVIEGGRDNSEATKIKDGRARIATGPFWDDIVFSPESGRSYVNLVQPVRVKGEYIGFLVVGVSLAELSKYVTEVGDLFNANAFILYGRDRVLAHPLLTQTHPEQSIENPVVAIGRVGDIVLDGIWSGQPAEFFDRAAKAGVNVVVSEVGDVEHVAFYRWVNDFGSPPWAIGAWLVSDDADEELERLAFAAAAGLAIAVIATLAAVLLGRRLARPISLLAQSATQIGALDLAHVSSLRGSRVRELNDQAIAFNSMLAGLRWFETYVPRTLVTRLIRTGDASSLESQERILTVMFTDIVGFTAESERLPAAEVASLLNEHFALLGGCVDSEGGTIDKFIGDGLMAFWGAPDEQGDTAIRACRAALKMVQAVEAENAKREINQESRIRVRIGIHSGPVVVGNIGAPGRMNYTIVGDTVNTGQRLESLGKELDRGESVTTLVSDAVASQVQDEHIVFEPAGSFQVKGKFREVSVYRLLAGEPVG